MIRIKRKPRVREIPTDEEIAALISILKQRYEQASETPIMQRCFGKDWLFTWLLVETGARVGEVVSIERRDIIERRTGDVVHHAILLRGTKSDAAERAVMIPRTLYKALVEYCQRWQLHGRILLSRFHNRIKERSQGAWLTAFCKEIELSCHVTPHTFRYRFIINLIKQGKSALEVMSRTGHTDVEMTVYYFNQVRRLMPWIEVNGDVALLENRKKRWQRRKEGE